MRRINCVYMLVYIIWFVNGMLVMRHNLLKFGMQQMFFIPNCVLCIFSSSSSSLFRTSQKVREFQNSVYFFEHILFYHSTPRVNSLQYNTNNKHLFSYIALKCKQTKAAEQQFFSSSFSIFVFFFLCFAIVSEKNCYICFIALPFQLVHCFIYHQYFFFTFCNCSFYRGFLQPAMPFLCFIFFLNTFIQSSYITENEISY